MVDFGREGVYGKEGGLQIRGITKASVPGRPLISIVTVVYNGETYLEQTIQSVIKQSYRNVEYIVIDGGSTDGTLDIIKKYEDRVDYWVSESDSGTYDAMNKGIALAHGDLIGLLNSDDYYEPDALEAVAGIYLVAPSPQIVYGNAYALQDEMHVKYRFYAHMKHWFGMGICHPAMFVHRDVYRTLGAYDLAYRNSADFDFMLRAIRSKVTFTPVDKFLANYRTTGISAVNLKRTLLENRALIKKYFSSGSREYILSSLVYYKSIFLIVLQKIIGMLFGGRILQMARLWYLKKFFVKEAEALK